MGEAVGDQFHRAMVSPGYHFSRNLRVRMVMQFPIDAGHRLDMAGNDGEVVAGDNNRDLLIQLPEKIE
jgi:hypothetical protein